MWQLLRIYLILLSVNIALFNGKREHRYKNWYRPWLALIYILIALSQYTKLKVRIEQELDSSYEVDFYILELIFISLVLGGWLLLKLLLAMFKINQKLDNMLRQININRTLKIIRGYDNYLLWPYKEKLGKISYRPGYKFFKIILWASFIIVGLAAIWSIWKYNATALVIPTAFSYLSLLVISEWIIYFTYKVKPTKAETNTAKDSLPSVDFEKIYNRFIQKNTGFTKSIISGFIEINNDPKQETKRYQNVANENEYITSYVNRVISDQNDLIISTSSFTDSVSKVAKVFFDTLNKGGNILIVVDIPNYRSKLPRQLENIRSRENEERTLTEIFGIYLQGIFENEVPSARNLLDIGHFSTAKNISLEKRIILCNIEEALSKELIHSSWMKELDLVVLFQFDDIYVDNLALKRQLSLWLEQQKRSFKSIFFTHYRAGGDEAISNIWVSSKDVPEVRHRVKSPAQNNYFLNFAYEWSIENLNQLLVGNRNEFGIAPGIELAVFPLMENLEHIHFFEGYNLDYIQSKNKLENLQSSFKTAYDDPNSDDYNNYRGYVSQAMIENAIDINNYPFIVRPFRHEECSSNHFSVVYDIENNAPKLYKKYQHLGLENSFICIVSKPHLFREFFAERMDYFQASTIESLALQLSDSEVNLCLQLLNLMTNEPIDINIIKSQLNAYSIKLKNRSVVSFIQELFNRYLHIDISKNAVLKSGNEFVFRDGKYEEIQTLKLDAQKLENNEIFEYLEKIKIIDFSRTVILELPKYMLFQNFLPQQNIIIDGISYEYVQFDEKRHELALKTKPTDNFSFNKLKTILKIENPEGIIPIGTVEKKGLFVAGKEHLFSIGLKESIIETHYSGYYKFDRLYHSPYSRRQTPKYIDLTVYQNLIKNSKRKYNTRFLHIQWEVPIKFHNKLPELTTQIHHLIYEFLPILFPYRHQYIQIASNNSFDPNHRSKTPWIFPESNFNFSTEKYIELFIIEDSFADLGLLQPIQHYFVKILKDLLDLLEWIDEPKKETKDTAESYYKGQAFYQNKLTFLNYGLSQEEMNWNIKMLIDFLRYSNLLN